MKRKVWNVQSTPTVKSSNGLNVRINPKSGAITFSKTLAEKLKLDKTGINFIQDEDRPQDWYIEPSNDGAAFRIRTKEGAKSTPQYIVQSCYLAKQILESSGLPLASQKFMVASEAVEKNMYAIITKSATTTLKKAS